MPTSTPEFKNEMERILAQRRQEIVRRTSTSSELDTPETDPRGVWGDKYHLKPATATPRFAPKQNPEAGLPEVPGCAGSIQRIAKVLGLDEEPPQAAAEGEACAGEDLGSQDLQKGDAEESREDSQEHLAACVAQQEEQPPGDLEEHAACTDPALEDQAEQPEEEQDGQQAGRQEPEQHAEQESEEAQEARQEEQQEGLQAARQEPEQHTEQALEEAQEEGQEEQQEARQDERQEREQHAEQALEEAQEERQADLHEPEQHELEEAQEERQEEEQDGRQADWPETEQHVKQEAQQERQEEREEHQQQEAGQDTEQEVEDTQEERQLEEEQEQDGDGQGKQDMQHGVHQEEEHREEKPEGKVAEAQLEEQELESTEARPEEGNSEEQQQAEHVEEQRHEDREESRQEDREESWEESRQEDRRQEDREEDREEDTEEQMERDREEDRLEGRHEDREEDRQEVTEETREKDRGEEGRQGGQPEVTPEEGKKESKKQEDQPSEEVQELSQGLEEPPLARAHEGDAEGREAEELRRLEEPAAEETQDVGRQCKEEGERREENQGSLAEAAAQEVGAEEEAAGLPYGEKERRLVKAIYSEAAKREGFICPVCFEQQRSGAALLAHYYRSHHAYHDSGPGRAEGLELAAQEQQEEAGEAGASSALSFSVGSVGSMAGSLAYQTIAGLLDVVAWPSSGPPEASQPWPLQGTGQTQEAAGDPQRPQDLTLVPTVGDCVGGRAGAFAFRAAGTASTFADARPKESEQAAPAAAPPAPPPADAPAAAAAQPQRAAAEPEGRGELPATSQWPRSPDAGVRPVFASSRAVLPSESAIWDAVVKGDVRRLEGLAASGALTSGCLRDSRGHSIFWDAVASQQPEAALWLLQRFPPQLHSGLGVDLSEVHSRRGDSLLHLAAALPRFSPAAAELFWALLHGGRGSRPVPVRQKNREGRNFVHVAATRLNFWILHSVLSSMPDGSALFTEDDNVGLSPIALLLHHVAAAAGGVPPAPPAPAAAPEAHLPEWWQLPRHVPRGCWGAPGEPAEPLPFADLWIEVEDPRAGGNLFRAAANRVILAASSRVLHREVKKLLPGEPLRVDPSCCRSGEALMLALRFLYGGDPRSVFAADAMDLWQLWRLCLRYALPSPLAARARAALLQALGDPQGAAMLPAVLQAADEVGLATNEALHLAWRLLSQPDVLRHLGADGAAGAGGGLRAKALTAALLRVERHTLEALERQPRG